MTFGMTRLVRRRRRRPEFCPLASPRFDMEPPARLFESVFGRVETKVAEPRQYFTATLPPRP